MSEVNDVAFGGFMVSRRVIEGVPVGYAFREQSALSQLNGWTLYSIEDDETYVNDPMNFVIVGATTLSERVPVMLEIFNAPYGTDLAWMYTDGIHTGFWSLKADREVSIAEILAGRVSVCA